MRRRVFVDNLEPSTTPEAITELFSGTGKVESVQIPPLPKYGNSPGHAFVVMSSAVEASKAILALNNTDWRGARLTVTHAGPTANVKPGFGGVTTASERKNRD